MTSVSSNRSRALSPIEGAGRSWKIAVLVILGVFPGAARDACGAPKPLRVPLDGTAAVAYLAADLEVYLEAMPDKGEGLLAFARRLTGSEDAASAIAELNGVRRLAAGVRYRVPFELLRADLQRELLLVLFPDDELTAAGWRHRVAGAPALAGVSLWRIAQWFTGAGENFSRLREANSLPDDQIRAGQQIFVPRSLLRPGLGRGLPDPATAAVPRASNGPLAFDKDDLGEFAVYRLDPGEALYSAVVVRFTGRLYAEDVNALAHEVAKRSGIADVTDIPVGFPVKIPSTLLLPEFLPAGHPRRLEYEASLSESRAVSGPQRARHLEGVTVVLDAGHGGKDVGASSDGVWESLYAYDVMLRTKALLEATTSARVIPTTRDGDGFRLADRDILPFSRGHQVLTTPPYPIVDSRVGVHLRWYLSNSIYRHAVDQRGGDRRVVFVSIHADSLHPSLRGAMVYIPSTRLSEGSMKRSGRDFDQRKEVREQPSVRFSWQQRRDSEGLSRQLAEGVIAAFSRRSLPVHPHKPVRERIIRRRQEFVPAVLRYNAVPAKILLEVCNLANREDRRLLQTRSFRESVAEALAEGILRYYGEQGWEPRPVQITAVGR